LDRRVSTRSKGRAAESFAAFTLGELGYRIIETNYLCRCGEIDIIAEHDAHIVFVEVRSSRSDSALDPMCSIDRRKCMKIMATADFYLATHPSAVLPARFDVVSVRRGNPFTAEVITNAFSGNDVY
jgi:putative endonuclease